MEINEVYSVRWANHHSSVLKIVERFCADETYADCSLIADGEEIFAHKLILSACSPFLDGLLRKHREKHPIIVLQDVSHEDLVAVVEYMYKGEVQVPENRLTSFLRAANNLKVQGLFTVETEVENSSKVKVQIGGDLEMNEVEYLSEGSDTNNEDMDYSLLVLSEGSEPQSSVQPPKSEEAPSKHAVSLIELPTKRQNVTRVTSTRESRVTLPAKKEKVADPLPPHLARAKVARVDEYQLPCDDCGGIYKSETTYLNHLRHDCNQVHSCQACNKQFKNKRHLLDHVRDDCGRVHVCPRCDKHFRQKVNLTTHQKLYCKPAATIHPFNI